jgi:hypothetical protein
MHINPQMVLGVVFVGALIAIVWAFVASEKKPKLSRHALLWLNDNFDKLVDESKKPAELVTLNSLRAANRFPAENGFELAHLIKNIAHIGHEIDEDTAAKAAAAMATSSVSPMGTAVIAASFAVYGINRADLRKAIAASVDELSG